MSAAAYANGLYVAKNFPVDDDLRPIRPSRTTMKRRLLLSTFACLLFVNVLLGFRFFSVRSPSVIARLPAPFGSRAAGGSPGN